MPFGLVNVTLCNTFSPLFELYIILVWSIVNQYHACWDCTDRFQLFLRRCLGREDSFSLVFWYSSERRAAQLHTYFLGSHSDFRLNIDGLWLNGTTDNNVHTGQICRACLIESSLE